MAWNLNSDRPIFMQLIEIIQISIISGKYAPGSKLPSVRDLASEAASTRIPCRKPLRNWIEAAWYFPREPAEDLLRRTLL